MQDTTICLTTTDEVLPGVLGLLPPGPAWDGARMEGDPHNLFWRAISATIGYVNTLLCAYKSELFCSTATQSVDQWSVEYGFDTQDRCSPYVDICSKAANQGGQSCSYFVELAAQNGWIITCRNAHAKPVQAGCARTGCAKLGVTPTYAPAGSNLGVGQLNPCVYGRVETHPYPLYWSRQSAQGNSPCAVPGSKLGQLQCCALAGAYSVPTPAANTQPYTACGADETYFTFPLPITSGASPTLVVDPCDTTGKFLQDTSVFTWIVTVDWKASAAARAKLGHWDNAAYPWSRAGTSRAGCTILRSVDMNSATCFLDEVKPAHTTLIYAVK